MPQIECPRCRIPQEHEYGFVECGFCGFQFENKLPEERNTRVKLNGILAISSLLFLLFAAALLGIIPWAVPAILLGAGLAWWTARNNGSHRSSSRTENNGLDEWKSDLKVIWNGDPRNKEKYDTIFAFIDNILFEGIEETKSVPLTRIFHERAKNLLHYNF